MSEEIKEVINNKSYQDRFKDAPFFDPSLTVIIAGLGGTGSNISYNLCRQNYEMYLYDSDTVDTVNIGSQMYSIADIGKNKAEVAMEVARKFGNDKDISLLNRFTEDSPIDNIVFSCFDNMESRKLIFSKWKEFQLSKTKEYREANKSEVNIFIDCRMVAENFQIYVIKTLKEIEIYETTLFSDDEVEPLPCSYKATCHTGTMIGGLATTAFLNHVVNKKLGKIIRTVPFYIQYDNAIMNYIKMNVNEYIQIKQ